MNVAPTSFAPTSAGRPARRRLLPPLNPPIDSWAGRRVWVVGASSGIGAALARALQARGARVAVSARRAEALQAVFESGADAVTHAPGAASSAAQAAATAPTAERLPPEILPPEILPLDVNDAAAVARACEDLRERWGGLDLVLWVAGIYTPMRAQDLDLPGARRMLDTNLVSVFGGLAAVLPVLRAQGSGGIALFSSVAGYSGLPQALVYGPTKAALINLAESLYLDLHAEGLGVYLVNPGYVDTPATAGNAYTMPALISADEAARATLAGLEAGRFEIHYPRRFTTWLKFARLLPYRPYFALVRKVTGL